MSRVRRFQRALNGHTRILYVINDVRHIQEEAPATGDYRERVLTEIAHLEGDIAYWKDQLAKAAEAGADLWDVTTIVVGDRVRYWAGWGTVSKIHPKSVKLAERKHGTLPYDQINAVQDADGRKVRIIDGVRTVITEEKVSAQ